MSCHIHQSIAIYRLSITSMTNASVLQIGAAGSILPVANAYNTGKYTGPAPGFPNTPAVKVVPLPPLPPVPAVPPIPHVPQSK